MLSWFKREKSGRREQSGGSQPIRQNFDESDAKELLKEIKGEYGLDYRRQEAITIRKLERFAIKNGFDSFKELSIKYRDSARVKRELINALTVGETYFYRELDQIKVIAELIRSHRCSSILSAPCSSGEEVYSILLYLHENGSIPPSLHITGIDINTDSLAAAKRGCYSQRSVSQLPDSVRESRFFRRDDGYCIDTLFKRYTGFARHNIFDREFTRLGKFDAVFSRNMLIYFTDEQKREALSRLRSVLKPEGVLFLGHADISFTPEGFEKVHEGRTTYYRTVY